MYNADFFWNESILRWIRKGDVAINQLTKKQHPGPKGYLDFWRLQGFPDLRFLQHEALSVA
jgi:hypothetical protein